jgi:outer membrane protein OmpA-like peptidoglycan-associated protein
VYTGSGRAGQLVVPLLRYRWKMLFVPLLTLKSSVGLGQSDPTPAPQRNFTIFFMWNSAELTTRDKETIAQAATHAKRLMDRQGTVTVRGYVDTSMSEQRSSALSERMAKAVRDELLLDSIAPAAITYGGVGKAQLLEATAEGVRKPPG